MVETEALVALGSNLGDREGALRSALDALHALEGVRVVAASGLYETSPVGGPPQGSYLNACALLATTLDAEALLRAMQGVEDEQGRKREVQHGPRTLDLDLLLFGDALIEGPFVRVPHPRMLERPFVMIPAREVGRHLEHRGRPLWSVASPPIAEGDVRLLRAAGSWWEASKAPSGGIRVSRTVAELRARLDAERREGRTVGLVPTMGALHEGHASLVRRALARCDVAVASIFVNPRQFAPSEDLASYPRSTEADLALLAGLGCDHAFLPSTGEMYPEGFCTRVEMDGLTGVLCGRSRPAHFGGVLTVVLKLLNQCRPDVAFFGRKDYQQSLVVRRMVRDLDVPVEIEVCPIVREPDGLALSSRNRYLGPEERADAPALRRALLAMDAAFRGGSRGTRDLVETGRRVIDAAPRLALDYLEVRDPGTLEPRDEARTGDLVAVAAAVGRARLIDNLLLGVEA